MSIVRLEENLVDQYWLSDHGTQVSTTTLSATLSATLSTERSATLAQDW